MIEVGKTYRTRAGHAVRLYATDGSAHYPIHGAINDAAGWSHAVWSKDGRFCVNTLAPLDRDLVPADPHGILPRHRELLAEAYESRGHENDAAKLRKECEFEGRPADHKAALIALARLDREKAE